MIEAGYLRDRTSKPRTGLVKNVCGIPSTGPPPIIRLDVKRHVAQLLQKQ